MRTVGVQLTAVGLSGQKPSTDLFIDLFILSQTSPVCFHWKSKNNSATALLKSTANTSGGLIYRREDGLLSLQDLCWQ